MIMNNNVDKQYFDLLNCIINNGKFKNDRTGTGTISLFDYTMRFNMDEGFPLLTSKKMFTKGIIHELIWFLKGDTNIKYLVDNDVHIWDGDAYKNYESKLRFAKKMQSSVSDVNGDEWKILSKEEFITKIKSDIEFAEKWGELGPVYGKQWRRWDGYHKSFDNETRYIKNVNGADQIANLISDLKNNPDSRRMMVSAWNVAEIDNMTLPPCHYGFQCYTEEMSYDERIKRWCEMNGKSIHFGQNMDEERLERFNFPKRKLSLKWTQRSVDVGLGLGFNIASYALLLHLLSKEVNMIPGDLIFSGGDCHIYINHIDGLRQQLTQNTYRLPKLKLTNISIDDLKYEDFEIIGYESSPSVRLTLSN